MVLDIQIVSQDMIKPSSPTPHHLLNVKLSALDQISLAFYVPTIFFYSAEKPFNPNFNRGYVSQHLKKSLSDVLVLFYPFAGRMKSLHSITCNDEGVEFIESQAHTTLSRVIENSVMEELQQFLPLDPNNQKGLELILAVQITYFDCGGIAIATCTNHKIIDGYSFFTFMNSWAATSIGASNITRPSFELAKHFPPTQASSNFEMPITGMKKDFLTKRFVFDKKMLTALKNASAFGSQVKNPSRVEAITAFIWRLFLKNAKQKNKKTSCSLTHAVNLRPRMRETDNIIGNLYKASMTMVRAEQYTDDLDIVSLMRNSMKELDKDIEKILANTEGYVDCLATTKEMTRNKEIEFCSFSSLTTFPMYKVDFGWGKPVWVCITTLPFTNMVLLMSTRCGEGIEAWINLYADDMSMVEHAYESLLLSLAE